MRKLRVGVMWKIEKFSELCTLLLLGRLLGQHWVQSTEIPKMLDLIYLRFLCFSCFLSFLILLFSGVRSVQATSFLHCFGGARIVFPVRYRSNLLLVLLVRTRVTQDAWTNFIFIDLIPATVISQFVDSCFH